MQNKKTLLEGIISSIIFPFKPGLLVYSLAFAVLMAIPVAPIISHFSEDMQSPEYQQQTDGNHLITFEGKQYTRAELEKHVNSLGDNLTDEQAMALLVAMTNGDNEASLVSGMPGFSLPTALLLLVVSLLFSTRMLDLTAQISDADYESPSFKPANYVSPFISLKLIGVMILLGLSFTLIAGLLPLISPILLIAILFSYPAIALTLIRTNSVMSTLNPIQWLETIRDHISWKNYFILMGLIIVMLIAAGIIQQVFIKGLLSSTAIFITLVIIFYLSMHSNFTMAYLMGFMTQHDTAEEFEASFNQSNSKKERQTTSKIGNQSQNTNLAEAKQVLQSGHPDDAITLINNALARETNLGKKLPMYRFLADIYQQQGNERLASQTQQNLINNVINQQPNLISSIYPELLLQVEHHDFTTPADVIKPLATYAFQKQNYEMTIKVIGNFAKKFPDHSDIVNNYLLVARSFLAKGTEPEKAYKILGGLLKKYPTHPLAAELKSHFLTAKQAVIRSRAK